MPTARSRFPDPTATPAAIGLRAPARRLRRAQIVAAALFGLAMALPVAGMAQITRPIPPSASLGTLEMLAFPEARIDGKPARLSAGTRIYDKQNLIVMPASLLGKHDVLFERDMNGHIGRVWILTDTELAAAQARLKSARGTGTRSGSTSTSGASAADAAAGVATQQ